MKAVGEDNERRGEKQVHVCCYDYTSMVVGTNRLSRDKNKGVKKSILIED